MGNRQWLFVAGLVACGWVAAQIAGPLAAQHSDAADNSDKVSEQDKEKKQELELDAQYAKAYLRLMDAILEKYTDSNRRQPNTIPSSVIHEIHNGARDARDRAQMFEKADPNEAAIYVACAESQFRAAQESLQTAENVNRASPDVVSAPQLDIFKAELALSKIRVEKARHLSAESPLSTVRFELGQLREEMQQLRRLVALAGERD